MNAATRTEYYERTRAMSDAEKRRIVRAAVKAWRVAHPGRTVRPVSHGWYGWVLWTTDGEAGPEAEMAQVVVDYLREKEGARC